MVSTPTPPEPWGAGASPRDPSVGDPIGGDESGEDLAEADDGARVLVASLGAWWVAIAAEDVAGVVPPAPVTPVGGTLAWVIGLAAVRGAVVPVVDARRLAGVERDGGTGEDAWWIVVASGGLSAAVAGLRVWRVAPVAPADAQADAAVEAAAAPPGLPARGVARLDGDGGRGANALPPAARRLDAAALLDLVHEPM